MTNAELVALLRDARESIAQDFDSGPAGRRTLLDLLKRIDAALAAHDAVPPSEVEWKKYGPVGLEARIGKADLTVRDLGAKAANDEGRYSIHISWWDRAPTLDEAKSAAIAAARGLK